LYRAPYPWRLYAPHCHCSERYTPGIYLPTNGPERYNPGISLLLTVLGGINPGICLLMPL